MPTLEECLDDLGVLLSTLQSGGPVLRIGKITAVGSNTVTADGFSMPFLDVGVTPVVGRIVVYLRQGTATVGIGMLAV